MSKPNTAPAQKLAYTRAEAAAQLGVHPITISRMTANGELRASRVCRRPLYTHEELQRFLKQGMAPAAKS